MEAYKSEVERRLEEIERRLNRLDDTAERADRRLHKIETFVRLLRGAAQGFTRAEP